MKIPRQEHLASIAIYLHFLNTNQVRQPLGHTPYIVLLF
jgi:hypothetical protein